jgi:uncharacterized membrane protein
MQCGNCGVEIVAGAGFCASCGKPARFAAGPTALSSQAPSTGLQPNLAGALCYLAGFVTGIVFLVLEPYRHDRFIRFHAFQSIFLNVAWVVVFIGAGIVTAILPGMLRSMSLMLHSLLSLVVFLLWLFLMYKAYQGASFKLPLIGDMAERQAQQTSSAR